MSSPFLRRSFLFVPGSDERKLQKAAGLGADAVVLDLEDSVPDAQKAEARRVVAEALRAVGFGSAERLVRLNGIGTEHFAADLRAIVAAGPDGLVIPKMDSPATLAAIAARIAEAEQAAARPTPLPLFVFIESARGLLDAAAIAAATSRTAALFLGAVDLATDLGVIPGPASQAILHHVRCQFLLAARAARTDAVDAVYINVKDLEGFRQEAHQAAALGFTGKLAIHPAQLPLIHEAFTPPPERVARAERILAAWDARAADRRGVFALDGQLIEKPVVEAERRLVARARRAVQGSESV